MRNLTACIVLLLLLSCQVTGQKPSLDKLSFLSGVWKIEGKEGRERWTKSDKGFVGESYKMVEGRKVVSETLELALSGNSIVYTATVVNQNDGKGIPFTLNAAQKDLFSFENPEHDFPKKIQYKVLNEKELFVSVLGEDDQGFSYKLIRQEQ